MTMLLVSCLNCGGIIKRVPVEPGIYVDDAPHICEPEPILSTAPVIKHIRIEQPPILGAEEKNGEEEKSRT